MSGGNMADDDRFRGQDPDHQFNQDDDVQDEPAAQHDPGRYRWQDESSPGGVRAPSRHDDDFGSFEDESGSDDATW